MEDLDILEAEYVGAETLEEAIAAGNRDVEALADIEFNHRHPERNGAKIQKGDKALTSEWLDIRDNVVHSAVAKAMASRPQTQTQTNPDPTSLTPGEDEGWSIGRVLKYGLGGLAGVLFLGWALKHREQILVEAKTATRHVGQLAGRAKSSLKAMGSERRSIREGVSQERQVAQSARRMRKLEGELTAADRRVGEEMSLAERKARELQALRAHQAGA